MAWLHGHQLPHACCGEFSSCRQQRVMLPELFYTTYVLLLLLLLLLWYAGKFLSDAIKEADTDRDGRVSIEEFTKYYERLAR